MSRRVAYELKEVTATTITSTFQDFGSPIENPCVIASFANTSDVEMYLSIDGINNTMRMPSGATLVLDTTNVKDHADNTVYLFRVNTQLQLKLQNPLATATWGDIFVNIITVTSK